MRKYGNDIAIAQNFVFCKKGNKLLGELEISKNVNF